MHLNACEGNWYLLNSELTSMVFSFLMTHFNTVILSGFT